MRKYIATFGVYENSSIMGEVEREIEAENKRQAKIIAMDVAREIEEEYAKNSKQAYMENGYAEDEVPSFDYWASLEELDYVK